MQLWMAEGFVDHDIPSKSSLEESIQSYLDALISSNLIMVDHIPSKKRTWPFSDMIKPTDPPSHNDWFPKFNVLNKLESLIAGYGDDSELIDQIPPPNEYHFPTSLKVLRLYGFLLRPALLSAIVALPELEILVLNTSDFSEDKWDASGDIYKSLKTFHLENVKLLEWQVDRETIPNLEELILEYCFKLMEIPSAFGDIDTFKSIRMVQSKRELGDSAMEMRKDVEAYTGENILHVHLSYEYSALGYEEESKEK
ncbi:hypothetical protein MTR67_012613, partial [Solanum verrucosum]